MNRFGFNESITFDRKEVPSYFQLIRNQRQLLYLFCFNFTYYKIDCLK
jgi:hypothetical protein